MEREEKKARGRAALVACDKHAAALRDGGYQLFRTEYERIIPCPWCMPPEVAYGWEYEFVSPQQRAADRRRAAAKRRGPATYRQGGGERARAGKGRDE